MAVDIDNLQQEMVRARDKLHYLSNEMAKIALTVQTLENRKVCEFHQPRNEILDKLVTNTEVIKTNQENLEKRFDESVAVSVEHAKTAIPFREMAWRHDTEIATIKEDNKGMRPLIIGNIVILLLTIISAAVAWGEMHKQVVINTERLDKIERTIYVNGNSGSANFDIKK